MGSHLLRAMLERDEEVVALVRAPDLGTGRARIEQALARAGLESPPEPGRLQVAVGDLSKPRLGLGTRGSDRVISECDQFLHCGATVRFNEPIERARVVNLGGTKSVIELAHLRERRGGVARVDHVSTAFVAGNRTDLVHEDELDAREGHKNSYERTKFEAEMAMRAAGQKLPVAIHRPSLVVGESARGRTSSFRTIYGPIRIYARGLWRTCPANRGMTVDVVPVDFVRDAMMTLRSRPDTIGGCFHLAAGPENSATIGELADVLHRVFPDRKPVRFVHPERWARYAHPLLRHLRFGRLAPVVTEGALYLPYLARMPRFDVTQAAAFAGRPPRVQEYIEKILAYCVDTDFGRRPVTSSPAAPPEGNSGSSQRRPPRHPRGTSWVPRPSNEKRPPDNAYETDNREAGGRGTARRRGR